MLPVSEKPTRAPHETWAHWKVASRNKESDHLSFRFGPPREGRFRRPIPPPLLRPSAIRVTCTSQECFAPQPGRPTQVCPGPCSFCASSWLLHGQALVAVNTAVKRPCFLSRRLPYCLPSLWIGGLVSACHPLARQTASAQTKYNSAHTGRGGQEDLKLCVIKEQPF